MGVTITGIKELQQAMGQHARQVPYIASLALNRTAKEVLPVLQHEIRDSFDRPTPYTVNSPYYTPANKSSLEVAIGIRSDRDKGIPAGKYLLPQVHGGARPLKRFEKALRSVGALPSNHFAIPGSGATLDAYGNMSRGQIVQILSYFKAFPEAGYKANMTAKRKASLAKATKSRPGLQYFVSDGKRMQAGIYARFKLGHGYAIKPVLIFVPYARYEQRLDFFYAANKAAESLIEKNLKAAMQQALSTARP